jgi:hypothetical protein
MGGCKETSMRNVLFAALGFAALAGVAGVAVAQQDEGAPARQHGVFRADANNDGTVTRQELDTSVAEHFRTMDANSDGQLTREEMRAGRPERGEGGDRRHHGRRGGGMHHLANADANNDGNITRDEFLARPIEAFDRLDANDDGVIAAAERPQRGERGERRGRHGDANADGQVSQAEFVARGVERFERLDANNDGSVTREEAEAARGSRHGR